MKNMMLDIKQIKNQIVCGDCIDVMKEIPENSIDAVITDPPYGPEFMSKDWDKFKASKQTKSQVVTWPGSGMRHNKDEMLNYQQFSYEWAKECFRILKPGGYPLAFGAPRTFHRLACGIEGAGFEIRDIIAYIYSSGFPKSLNVAKAIQKKQGVELYDTKIVSPISRPNVKEDLYKSGKVGKIFIYKEITTPEAKQWKGWGTALKPAIEPIIVARKPLSEKTVAENVLKWGTGGINIDGCRIKHNEPIRKMKAQIGGNKVYAQAGRYKETTELKTRRKVSK